MILCCGEALIDMVPLAAGNGFEPCPGGSPYNTAIAAARLDAQTAFLGKFSTDFFGELLLNRLTRNGVSGAFIIRSGENSPLAFVTLKQDAEPQYIFYTTGTAGCSLSPQDIPPVLPGGIRSIVFGSIAMTIEPMASAIEALVEREFHRGVPAGGEGPVISFDPNIRPFMIPRRDAYLKRFERWLSVSNIAKVSAQDFEFIYPGLGLEQALRKVLAGGPTLAVSTRGPEGALALLKRQDGTVLTVQAPVLELPVADTIGAGDTFHGALLARLERRGKLSRSALASLTGPELYDALYFANKAASLVCARKGAEPPTLAEVERGQLDC